MSCLRLKTIHWHNLDMPGLVKGNLHMVATAIIQSWNWKFVRYEPVNYKLIIKSLGCQMCIYLSTMSVQTALDHPKLGKTQLTRRNVTQREFVELLKNPRAHTDKGYHKKIYKRKK